MTVEEIKKKLLMQEYDFLRENENLGGRIGIISLGGSYAYGTNNENSDIDLRGFALNSKMQILANKYPEFEQFADEGTDTVIYSFNKLVNLLSNANPNTIEMLGNRPEHYLYVSPIGQELLDHAQLFLSKKAVNSFGGYAAAQLRRLDNKAVRLVDQGKKEKHILNSIMNAYHAFPEKYFQFPEDGIKLYIDQSGQEEYETEIFMDIRLRHYPLRDYKAMWSEMNNIVKEYAAIGKRNKNAISHQKLGKHMMHLIRLYMMCLDILEKEQIITYREKEHDLLMEIRNGKYLDDNNQPIPEFFEMVDEYDKKLEYAKENTCLPENPDYKAINEFVASVNERVVRGEV